MGDALSIDHMVLTAFGLLIASVSLSILLSARRLKRWAATEGVAILKWRFASGLGSDTSGVGLLSGWCYYVKIVDKEKRTFICWVKVGGLLAAIRDAKIEVMWDNRPTYLY